VHKSQIKSSGMFYLNEGTVLFMLNRRTENVW